MLIDFHAQILPGMDSCHTHLVSIRRLLSAQKAGIDLLVATPMLDLNRMPAELFLQRREVAAQHLEMILQEGMPGVELGAEVLWNPALEREELRALTTGADWLLLRLPDGGLTDEITASLRALRRQVSGVLITNVERLDYADAQTLFALGCKGEMSFTALSHHKARELWMPSLKNGDIAALGSDYADETHVYHKLRKLPARLEGAFEPIMERAAEILQRGDTV